MLASHTKLGAHDAYLGDFTESPAFFSEIDDNAAASVLGFLDGLLDSKNDYRQSGVSLGKANTCGVKKRALRHS